jgi:hypothetical protein
MKSSELKKMTKIELLNLALARKLNVTSKMLKADLIEALTKDAKAKQAKVKRKTAAKKTKRAPAARSEKPQVKIAPKRAAKRAGRIKAKAAERAAEAPAPRKKAARRKPAAREKRLEAETIRQKAEAGKYYLGAEEGPMPPVEAVDVPAGYGLNRIAAMVRDPHWIFAYWEVTGERYRELENTYGASWPSCRMILRVHDITGEPSTHFDIEIQGGARNWYINVTPQRRYRVAIGVLSPDGRFEEIAVSNIIETPRMGMSDVIDDRWMVPEDVFRRIFAASGGHDIHAGSEELRELLEKRLLEQVSSGAVSSISSEALPARERGFRLWVATELILYGATEPDARVTVQGKEIKLRGDGTFSLRFALPDGTIDLPVHAFSADGVEERSVETTVRKKSGEREPVIR